jgi:hypothetical protein
MAGIRLTDNHEQAAEDYTFKVNCFFDENITLGEILAHRVLQNLSQKTLENQGKTACNPGETEV